MLRAISINVKPRARCTAGKLLVSPQITTAPRGPHFGLLEPYVSDAAGDGTSLLSKRERNHELQ